VSFVDTNVLVYATAVGAPFRDQARAALARLATGETLSVSRQILHEYIAVMTRQQNWGKPLALSEATAEALLHGSAVGGEGVDGIGGPPRS
jgi:predicted nucleic acid-binding protein